MADRPRIPEDELNAYLDGAMTPAQAGAFELRLAGDADAAEVVRSQRRIDESLRRAFVPPPAAPPVFPVREAPASGARSSWLDRNRGWAVAAAALLAVSASWLAWPYARSLYLLSTPEGKLGRGISNNYHAVVNAGFKPKWVCTTDEEFAATTKERLGVALLPCAMPEGVEIVGWAYADTDLISCNTSMLLARADGEQIVMFIDKVQNDRAFELPAWSGLNDHRTEIGGVVIHEVSPSPRARFTSLFHVVTPDGGIIFNEGG
ncbi:MAG: hypothetical protein JNM07_00415 [Phycisphaerae bacterium]|nr:hypothetical protein [Phycisphaerae bacterium]